jgi:hypothetical protein
LVQHNVPSHLTSWLSRSHKISTRFASCCAIRHVRRREKFPILSACDVAFKVTTRLTISPALIPGNNKGQHRAHGSTQAAQRAVVVQGPAAVLEVNAIRFERSAADLSPIIC